MKNQEIVLLAWLQKVLDTSIQKIEILRNPRYFYDACQKIQNFNHITFSQSQNLNNWSSNFTHLKKLHQQIRYYFKKIINCPLPVGMSPVNCLQIAKGDDHQNQGLLTLLTLIFIGCLKSENKKFFIDIIMNLQSNQQNQLMNIFTQYEGQGEQQKEDDIMEQAQKKNEQLCFRLQQLDLQNQALHHQLQEQMKQKKLQKQAIRKLQQQLQKIKKQLSDKTIIIQQIQQKSIEHQTSKQIISESNQQFVIQLKQQLIQNQKKYLQSVGQLKIQIQSLKQQLQLAKIKNNQLQQSGVVLQNRKVQHKDFIRIVQHRNILYQQQTKVKNGEKKKYQLEKRIVVLQGEINQMCRKNQKMKKQLQKLQEKQKNNQSCSKISGQYISQKNAKQLKFSFLKALKTDLQRRITIKGSQ